MVVPTATTDDSKTRRVKEITTFIRSHGWSLNEFLEAFYSSQDPSISAQRGCCLAKSDGSRFAPEELIDLWFKHCPSNSRGYLESVIIDRAGRIIIRETNKACKLDSLCVPTTKLGADDLDQEFLLSKLEGVYTETLPHLWLLLNMVTTSWNYSEKRKKEASVGKQSRARFVEYCLRFVLPFQLNAPGGVGLCCHHQHLAFCKKPGHECLPNSHGAVPWYLWGHQTCLECVQPYGSFYQLRVGLWACNPYI